MRVETKENPIIDHSAKACVNNSENKSSVDKRSQRSSRDLGNEEDLIGSDEETEWLSEDKLHLSIESNAASPVKPKTEAKNDTSGNDKGKVIHCSKMFKEFQCIYFLKNFSCIYILTSNLLQY